jgi:8-oxo-dGTP pyrophosphatase MutT (NUDIX family)
MKRRNTARLLVIDARKRVLFFLVNDGRAVHPAHPDLISFWLLPGGGIDPGETSEEAALRELREETGITDATIGPLIWVHERILNTHGDDIYFYEEIFVVYVTNPLVNMYSLLPYEVITHQKLCWLSAEQIQASETLFMPLQLPELIGPILAGELPEVPVSLVS